jgi:hypothetical protein
MELHIVFFNEILKSYDEAIKSPTGLTVISILGQVIDMYINIYIR